MLWQHLNAMVIDKVRKMTVKGVNLKSESFFLISPGVLELWRKNLKRGIPGMDRVNPIQCLKKVDPSSFTQSYSNLAETY